MSRTCCDLTRRYWCVSNRIRFNVFIKEEAPDEMGFITGEWVFLWSLQTLLLLWHRRQSYPFVRHCRRAQRGHCGVRMLPLAAFDCGRRLGVCHTMCSESPKAAAQHHDVKSVLTQSLHRPRCTIVSHWNRTGKNLYYVSMK